MARSIRPKVDALFVEGQDDGAAVNAVVRASTGLDIGPPVKLVKLDEHGGGVSWALRQFDAFIERAQEGSRVGLIVDRDGVERRPDNWPAVRERARSLIDEPNPGGLILDAARSCRFGM